MLGCSAAMDSLPVANWTAYNPKERVRHWRNSVSVTLVVEWAASAQLVKEPRPFVAELPLGYHHALDCDYSRQLGLIKFEISGSRLGVHRRQIGVDRGAGRTARAKPVQLRMILIAGRFAPEHGTRE
jgi:hypothetical protein